MLKISSGQLRLKCEQYPGMVTPRGNWSPPRNQRRGIDLMQRVGLPACTALYSPAPKALAVHFRGWSRR